MLSPFIDAKNKTNQILIEAAMQVEQTGLPALIVGDFNVSCQDLPVMQQLSQEGYQTMEQLFLKMYGCEMPFTCREATRPDQAIVHPKLIPFVSHIEVNKTKIVPDHDPLVFHISLPNEQPKTQNWNLPKSWIQYEPDPALVEFAFKQNWAEPQLSHEELSLSDALKLWATTCENSVDWALKMQHAENPEKFPQKNLPKNARGRHQTRKLIQRPITCIPQACDGQYNPQIEIASFRLKHWTRQLRRLQSFLQRIRKLQHLENLWPDVEKQLHQEWDAIVKAKGFKHSFPDWCFNLPEIGFFPISFPDENFLMIVIQILRHDCDRKAAEERSLRNKLSKFARHQDSKQRGLQQAAKEVKAHFSSNLAQTVNTVEMPFTLLSVDGGLATLELAEPSPFQFQGVVKCEEQFVDIRGREVDVMLIDADKSLPFNGVLTQTSITMEPEKIAKDLTTYWNDFWKRDTRQELEQEDTWTDFNTFLHEVPALAPIHVDIEQIDVWIEVIRKSRSQSARGVDGWYMDEIKTLPTAAITALAKLFAQHKGQAFGEKDMQVITIPMGKVDCPEKPSQTRPITLLGMIYRIWSKVSSKIILRQLQKTLPESIIGFIPGRSMQLAMLRQQFEFEQLHRLPNTCVHWEGVTLDIIKCFNAIARLPAKQAMLKLGIPETWLNFWTDSLNKTQRYWKIHDQLCVGDSTTTGCPEGDCWSIIACLGISYIWVAHATQGTTFPLAFADNWNWRSQDTDSNIRAIQSTIKFLSSIKLDIDWNKTWIWCTRSVIKKEWKQRLNCVLPAASVRVVTSARELGYTMHYNRMQNRHTQRERTADAMKRWKRLQRLPLSLDDKGKIAHWALIKAFFATECYAVGQSWIQKARTAITKCLIHNRKNTNPHLATMILTRHTKDPELLLILESLRAVRHLLWHSSRQKQHEFCHHAAHHSRKHSDVYGPAGALSFNLAKLGWSLNGQGVISTGTVVCFSLMNDAMPTIEKFLEQSWMRHIMQAGILRPAWRNFPPIDRKTTLSIFSSIPERQKRIGSYHLTGSCMMNDQKRHFTDLTEQCQLCGQPDSETHRLLECFETSAVRQNFPELINFLQDHDECNHHLPVVWETPNWEFDWLFFQTRPALQIDRETLETMQRASMTGTKVLIFTDGSCNKMDNLGKQIAASAIVCHAGCSEEDKKIIVERYNQTKIIPSTYKVIGVGECNGEQTIPRAELQAVIAIASCNVPCEIYTDSQYVVDLANKLRQYPDLAAFHKCRNFDNVAIFWKQLREGNFTLHKVKAGIHTLQMRILDLALPNWEI